MAVIRRGAILGFLAIACGGDVGDGNTTGSQGATCTADSACNPGLVCFEGQCVPDEKEMSGGASAGGGAGAGDEGTGGAKPVATGGVPQSSGGLTGTGGRPVSSGGAAGIGGVAGTGGAVIGGAGGATFECTPGDPSLSECDDCVHTKCCSELQGCNDPTCAGDSTQQGELVCIIECTQATYVEMGLVTTDDLFMCASACAWSDGIVAPNTDALITCMNAEDIGTGYSNCAEVCLGLF